MSKDTADFKREQRQDKHIAELEDQMVDLKAQVDKLQSIIKALVGDLTMYSNLPTHIRNIIQEELTCPSEQRTQGE